MDIETKNNVTKIEELLNEIKSGKADQSALNELKAAVEKRNEELEKIDKLETKMEEKMAAMVDKITGAFESASHKEVKQNERFKSFGEFLQKVRANSVEIKDLAESAGGTGGYLVPEVFSNEIMRMELENTVVRSSGARVVNMTSNIMRIPALNMSSNAAGSIYGGAAAYWGKENTSITESEPNFERITLELKKLTGYTESSEELTEDAIISVGGLLSQMFAEVLAFEEDYAFINGNGINQPLGILNAPALVTVSRATSSIVSTADVINMYSRFRGNINRAVFLINQSTLPSIYKLKDENNNYIWAPGNSGSIAQGAAGTLYGIPIKVTEKCPAVGTTGDIILADFGHYLIGDKGGVRVEESAHFKFQTDQRCWKIVKRVDGQPWLDSAITPRAGGSTLSPFVAVT